MALSEKEARSNLSYGVTVVIPAYNYARFLSEAIMSATSQTYLPLEIIVIDDGSTDDTPRILSANTDSKLRCIHKKNAGLSAARNTGIREACYPFIAFLDADDRWVHGFLKSTMALFHRLPHNYAMVACASQRMSVDGILVQQPRSLKPPPTTLTARHFILLNRVFPSAIVARKSVFIACGYFDESLKSSEDRDMWIRITAKHYAYYLDEVLVHIRRHGDNMSRNSSRMRNNTSVTLSKAWKSNIVSKLNITFWFAARSYFEYQSAWTHFSDGRRMSAIKYMAFSLIIYPFFFFPSKVGESIFFRLRALRHFLSRPAIKPPLRPLINS